MEHRQLPRLDRSPVCAGRPRRHDGPERCLSGTGMGVCGRQARLPDRPPGSVARRAGGRRSGRLRRRHAHGRIDVGGRERHDEARVRRDGPVRPRPGLARGAGFGHVVSHLSSRVPGLPLVGGGDQHGSATRPPRGSRRPRRRPDRSRGRAVVPDREQLQLGPAGDVVPDGAGDAQARCLGSCAHRSWRQPGDLARSPLGEVECGPLRGLGVERAGASRGGGRRRRKRAARRRIRARHVRARPPAIRVLHPRRGLVSYRLSLAARFSSWASPQIGRRRRRRRLARP